MKVAGNIVTEIQGLYGAFSFPEKLLQKIWLRGDFNHAAAATTGGRKIKVLHPGKWNLLGGPDFRDARLVIGDAEIFGDVEVHLRAPDWDAHGHVRDRAYDRVVLHVVLFPPEARQLTIGAGGREIPVLVLLPLLQHDLEEYAADEAVESLANRPMVGVIEELSVLSMLELLAKLRVYAEARWRQKTHFAHLRIQRLGWEAACHQTALEVLGYRYNRAPMLRIATAWPLKKWASGAAMPDALFASEEGMWSLHGVRPANQPRTRLRQYAAWTKARPDWPARVVELASRLPEIGLEDSTREARRINRLTTLREELLEQVCGGAVGGTRFDNLVCDGVLPLLAVQTKRKLDGLWFHWFVGDAPPFVSAALRQLSAVDRNQPNCHGSVQGLLGWLIGRDTQR